MPARQLMPDDPILVGEKDARETHNLLSALVELGFRNVIDVNSAYKFLQYARVQKFALAFIGSSLGGPRAVDALGNVRTSSENTGIPLVFMYAKTEKDLAKNAAEFGADNTLQYPIDARRLKPVLEDLFDMYVVPKSENGTESKPEAKKPGDSEIDLHSEVAELPALTAELSALAAESAVPTESLVNSGQEMLEKGDLAGAAKVFSSALKNKDGASIEVCFGLAEACLGQGDRGAAEKALKEAERIEPFARREFRRRAPAFVRRGHQKLKEERYEDAILEFEGAIFANHKSVGGYFGLGEVYRAMGDMKSAEEVFRRTVELDAEPVDLHVYNEMGLIARRKREFVTALFAFDKAITFAPRDAVLHYNKAMVYVAQKKYDQALPLLQKAVKFDPQFVEARQAENTVASMLSGLRSSSAA